MKSINKVAVIGLLSIFLSISFFGCSGNKSVSGYKAKKIEYSGTNYKKFRQAAEKVFEEYRTEITDAVHQENWALVKRELMDYWELVDGLTPDQTGSITHNERYQNAYDNFAAKILIEEAQVLMDKQDEAADDVLIEQILSIQPSPWSVKNDSRFSSSNGKSVMLIAAPTITQLAKLKGRSKIYEYLSY